MKKQQHSPRGRITLITTLVALGLSWGSSQLSWAEPGALAQLPVPNGCIRENAPGLLCTDGVGLDAASSASVSPDGKHVYVTSEFSDAIAVFARNKTTGVLTQLPAPNSCISETGDGVTCTAGAGLDGASAVAVSPDGNHVYVASNISDAITVFARNKTTGVLTQLPAPDGCISDTGNGVTCTDGVGLNNTHFVTVSPDGKHVYVASLFSDAITVFARNKTTGVLTQLPAPDGCISDTGDGVTCTDGVGLNGVAAVTVSKDGKHLYAVSQISSAVTVFARNKTTGVLTQLPAFDGCISETGEAGLCVNGVGLGVATAVTVSPDGGHVYVASLSSDALTVFARNKMTGVLTQLPVPDGCISDTDNDGLCTEGVGLDGLNSVTISKDGKHVYAAAGNSDALTVFARNKTTGVLTQLPAPDGCVSETGHGGLCTNGLVLDGPQSVIVSQDGKHVYAVSFHSDSVTVFAREK